MGEYVDVVVVGAGISGIGAGYHLQTMCPGRSYAILEARDDIGGTWDLFRYPGVRSDSDMHTLGYRFKPWVASKAIADGPSIMAYLRETVAEFGIDRHIRFGHAVRRAEWSSEDATWTVSAERTAADGTTEPVTITCNYLFMCSGYYSYGQPYDPEIPGLEQFAGEVVHPQFWPDDLDDAGKRVVVIGSGATAMTLVPAMAATAGHVTMLQRSPTYVVSRPDEDVVANGLRRVLPDKVAYAHHPAQERRHAAVLLRPVPEEAGEVEGQARRPDPQGAARRRRRHPLHAALQPVGPAPVPHPQRRPLRGDPR